MTTTYHTPVATGAAANAATFNTPYSQLDSRLVQIDNAVDTDGTLKAGAVDGTAVLADNVVTNAKIADTTITAGKLVSGTITATQIADTTITAGKLVNGTITATQIADTTITDAKLAKPVRIAWGTVRIGSGVASVAAHATSDTEWDFGVASGNMVIVNRVDAQNSPGITWDAWMLSDKHVIIRATNATANTVNIHADTDLLVGILDLVGSLSETTESQVV